MTAQMTPVTDHSFEHVTYLFGNPIAHSLSPLLHNTLYRESGLSWHYELFESNDIQAFLHLLKDPRCMGSSVTMPHKVAITKYLDGMTQEGWEVGACNTIFVRTNVKGERMYIGTNTDVIGIREAFAQNIEDIYEKTINKPGLVIGGGGAARSAIYTLSKYMRCSQIYMVNRDKSEVDAVIESCRRSGFGANVVHVDDPVEASALPAPVIAVGCVPDFPPVTEAEKKARLVVEIMLHRWQNEDKGSEPVDSTDTETPLHTSTSNEQSNHDQDSVPVILEMAYHPRINTDLSRLAEEAGWQVILGPEAVLWQGIEQDRLWTGMSIDEIPVRACKEVIEEQLRAAAVAGEGKVGVTLDGRVTATTALSKL